MSAGTGIQHSEHNASDTVPVHFLQIWIRPDSNGLEAGCEQVAIAPELKAGEFHLIAASNPQPGSVQIPQAAAISATEIRPGKSADLPIPADRSAYLQVASGQVLLKRYALKSGDGALLVNESTLHLDTTRAGKVLVFILD